MIKELFAICSAVSVVGSGPVRNYQHTENVGNTTVTYRYESNEVNSIDDIVLDHIYYIDVLDLYDMYNSIPNEDYFNFTLVNFSNSHIESDSLIFDEYWFSTFYGGYSYLYSYYNIEHNYVTFSINSDEFFISIEFDDVNQCSFDNCVFYIDNSDSLIAYKEYLLSFQDDVILPSYTDFNVIESVDYQQKNTFIGVINEFCEDYLFSEIPGVNSMTFEIGGETISLMTYLVLITGIIVAFALLILLFFVFKWLFGMFAGLFKVK